MKILKRI